MSKELHVTLKSMLGKIESRIKDDRLPLEMRQYFHAAAEAARLILTNDFQSKSARHRILRYRYLTEGMIAGTRFIEVAAEDGDNNPGGSHFPGLNQALCLGKCLAAYNKCMGRTSDEDEDDSDPGQILGSDTNGDDDNDDLLGPALACNVEYTNCIAGCLPPVMS